MIVLEGIVKKYKMGKNEVVALAGVSLVVEDSEFVAILGPSGSGKSTLMNIIGCIDVPDQGHYFLDGADIDSKDEDDLSEVRNEKIGFVFQKFNLLAKYTAVNNVAFPLLLRGVGRKEAYQAAQLILEKVGLGDRLDHKPSELSGGQQQRVAIARAVVTKPSIILADEPTGALDSKSGQEIIALFKQLNDEGITVIVITHDIDVANEAERIIHIKDGQLNTSG